MGTSFIHLNFCIMAWLKVHTVLHQPETEVDEYLWWTQQNVWMWKKEGIFFKLNCLIVTLVLPSQQFCKLWTHWGSRQLPSCPTWTPSWPSSSCPSSWCTCSTWTRSPPHLRGWLPWWFRKWGVQGEGWAHWCWSFPNRHNGLMRPHCPGWHILSETTLNYFYHGLFHFYRCHLEQVPWFWKCCWASVAGLSGSCSSLVIRPTGKKIDGKALNHDLSLAQTRI